MTYEKLRNVPDFTIFNKHGKIYFIGESDLTEVNLSETVNINECEVEVYD